MITRRLVTLFLLMMAAVSGIMAGARVTDDELAKAVVEKTKEILTGPTARIFSLSDYIQEWVDSLEEQVAEAAYSAVNSATEGLSFFPFNYFNEQPPESMPGHPRPQARPPPVIYLFPQSHQYLYNTVQPPPVVSTPSHQTYQPPGQGSLAPTAANSYQTPQVGTHNSPAEVYPQQHQPITPPHYQDHYLQSAQDPLPLTQDHYLEAAKDPQPPVQDHYPQSAQDPLPLAEDPYLQYPPDPLSVSQDYFQPDQDYFQFAQDYQPPPRPILQGYAPGLQNPVPSYLAQYPSQQGQTWNPSYGGSPQQAREKLFAEERVGDSPNADAISTPNDKLHQTGPHFPDLVEGGYKFPPSAPYPPKSSSSGASNRSLKGTVTPPTKKYAAENYAPPVSEYRAVARHANSTVNSTDEGREATNAIKDNNSTESLSRSRRSDWDSLSFWHLMSNDIPQVLYCPSEGIKLFFCAGDLLFDQLVKAPIETLIDWVSTAPVPH